MLKKNIKQLDPEYKKLMEKKEDAEIEAAIKMSLAIEV